jgi:hypothetical protein
MPKRWMWNLFVCGLLLSLPLVRIAAADDAGAARPELTGHWVLNGKASQFPTPGGGEGGGAGGGGYGHGGGHGGGHGMGGGGGHGMWGGGGESGGGAGGPGGGGGARGGGGQGGGRMQQLPTDMVVELGDSELIVSERGLPVRKLELDAKAAMPAQPIAPSGSETSASAPATEQAMIVPAHWDGSRLVSEYPSRRGALMHETWELSKDGKQLTVKIDLPATGERPGIEMKRVYDRSEAD